MNAHAPGPCRLLGVLLLAALAACSGSTGGVGGPLPDAGGGGGVCTPSACMPGACGPTSDGCGGTLDCGGCGTFTCSAAMTPGYCGSCTADGWCAERPVVSDSMGLAKVAAVSSTSIWASGSDGLVLEWDGAAWHDRSSKVQPDGYYTKGPGALWGSSPSNVWGVSEHGLWHWDGVKWALTAKSGWWPNAIAGASANDIWVVGNGGLVAHFDGSTWTRVDSPVTADLLSVSVRTANDAWAAGLSGALLHWDGASWKQVGPADGTGGWSDVRASAEGEAWLLATDGAVYRWKGSFDYMRASRSGYGYLVQALWAFSPTDVWLVGENGLSEHWDGTSFVPVETATNAVFRDVTGAPNGDVWAVGQSLNGVAFRRAAR